MPLETATYIHQLNAANPLGSDPIAAGDDHIRLIKSALQATLPNVQGVVNVSHTDLNNKVPNAVQKDGSVAMTGELPLAGNPTTALGATPKQYVDAATSNLTAAVALKADKATTISAGAGLTGGGDLSANRTLAIATTGVTPGNYGSALQVPVITVNDKGQITAASTATITGLGQGNTVWNNVTGSRSFGATYTNSRNYPIAVSATATCAVTSTIYGYVNNMLISWYQWQFNGCGSFGGCFMIVPPGATYRLDSSQGVYNWVELY